jgi:hypothetical protein
MLAEVVVLLGSVAAAVVPAGLVLVVQVPVPHEAELRVLVQVPPQAVRPHLLPLLLPQVVVESEVTLHLQGCQSFSAAMARSSLPTVQPTFERAPSTR